jgi:hypothetical protein
MFMMSRTFTAVLRVSGRHRHLTIREWTEGVSPWRGGNLGGMAFSPAVPAARRSQVGINFRGADDTVQLDLEPCRSIAIHAAMDDRVAAGSEVANRARVRVQRVGADPAECLVAGAGGVGIDPGEVDPAGAVRKIGDLVAACASDPTIVGGIRVLDVKSDTTGVEVRAVAADEAVVAHVALENVGCAGAGVSVSPPRRATSVMKDRSTGRAMLPPKQAAPTPTLLPR